MFNWQRAQGIRKMAARMPVVLPMRDCTICGGLLPASRVTDGYDTHRDCQHQQRMARLREM